MMVYGGYNGYPSTAVTAPRAAYQNYATPSYVGPAPRAYGSTSTPPVPPFGGLGPAAPPVTRTGNPQPVQPMPTPIPYNSNPLQYGSLSVPARPTTLQPQLVQAPSYPQLTPNPYGPTSPATYSAPQQQMQSGSSSVPNRGAGGLPTGGDYVGELGRAAWKVLHATSEQFPQFPTLQEQQAAIQFLQSFSILYPCQKCRIHFQTALQRMPPDVSSQAAFNQWMVAFHNEVNSHLGKPSWN